MYEGKNPKALLSISLITEAFIREMHHKKYEEINVKDLCKEADVSRQTFYNIFRTKEDVLRKCIDNIFDMILNQRADTVDAIESIHIFVKTFYENRDFMDLLIRNFDRGICFCYFRVIKKYGKFSERAFGLSTCVLCRRFDSDTHSLDEG